MKGFSRANLMSMRAFAEAWPDSEFVQAVLAQLTWYHQLALLDKLSIEDRVKTHEQNHTVMAALQHYSYCPRQCALIHVKQATLRKNRKV